MNIKSSYIDILNVFAKKCLSSKTGFDNTVFEKPKGLLKMHHKSLGGIGEKVNGIVLNFCQSKKL